MMRAALFFAALLLCASAQAATVSIDVTGIDGKPLAGAVVLIDTARPVPGPVHFPWPSMMEQRNISFQPHVLIVPVGSSVAFPNRDKVRHHVYSFSKTKKFELQLYGKDESRSVLFDKPGVVAVGCNIHDSMSGFILVVTTPFAAQSDQAGHVAIANVPPGPATIRLWHPSIRTPDNMLRRAVAIDPAGLATKLTASAR